MAYQMEGIGWRSTDHRCEIEVAADQSTGLALVKQNKTVIEVGGGRAWVVKRADRR